MRIQFALLLAFLPAQACALSLATQTLKTERKNFPAAGLTGAHVEAGAGKLEIAGRAGATEIEVLAEFRGRDGASPEVLENLKLTMETRGTDFVIRAEEMRGARWGSHAWIDLTITVPPALALKIKDGSGGMSVRGIDADVSIEDGSGEVEVEGVGGNLRVSDGSGGIRIRDAGRDVEIQDGSGSVDVLRVGGNVRIDDGSGSITVRDVGRRLDVPSGGSGSVRYSDVRGEVRVPNKRRRSE